MGVRGGTGRHDMSNRPTEQQRDQAHALRFMAAAFEEGPVTVTASAIDPIFQPLTINGLTLEEPRRALQHRRTRRLLRRVDVRSPDRLGPPLRARRCQRDHLLQRGHPHRRDRGAGLREHRPRPHDPLVAQAHRGSAPARLPLHHPAPLLRPAARSSAQGVHRRPRPERHRQAGSALRAALPAHDDSRDPRVGAGLRAAPRGAHARLAPTASRSSPATAISCISSCRAPSTTARTSTTAISRRAPESCSRSWPPCGPRSAGTSSSR